MAHINTITIAPQESADDLAAAFAAALGGALGWMVDGTSVWQDKTKDGLRFFFRCNSSYIYACIGNSLVTYESGNRLSWAANTYYYLEYYNAGNTVAMGIHGVNGSIALCSLIAKNTLGAWKAMCCYSNVVYYLDSVLSSSYSWSPYIIRASNACTSIVKFPDPWGGCMFQDLYLMISCPYDANDKVFYLNGQYYRYVGVSGTYGFAIPVG